MQRSTPELCFETVMRLTGEDGDRPRLYEKSNAVACSYFFKDEVIAACLVKRKTRYKPIPCTNVHVCTKCHNHIRDIILRCFSCNEKVQHYPVHKKKDKAIYCLSVAGIFSITRFRFESVELNDGYKLVF